MTYFAGLKISNSFFFFFYPLDINLVRVEFQTAASNTGVSGTALDSQKASGRWFKTGQLMLYQRVGNNSHAARPEHFEDKPVDQLVQFLTENTCTVFY